MKSTIKLFVILITITVIVVAWITHRLQDAVIQTLIAILIVLSVVTFFVMNMLEAREEHQRRRERESKERPKPDRDAPQRKTSDVSYALKEKKSGLTWGGGNIKGSEATRGTKRKFLGR
jgi:large-conductance mechanosensitive channel